MSKRQIFLPILSLILGVSGLSGCAGINPSSLSGLLNSSTSTGESSIVSSTTSASSSTSSASSTSISSSTPIEEGKLDLTAPPKPHNAIVPTDAQVVELVSIGESSVTKIDQIPSSTILLVKNLISKAFLSESQVHLISSCAHDFIKGIRAENYKAASSEFGKFSTDVMLALESIDGDQIGYLLQEIAPLAQQKKDEAFLPYGLIFGLANAADYQGALTAFGNDAGFANQFALYKTYFDGSVSYREDPAATLVTIPSSLAIATGRAFHLLLRSFFETFPLDEQTLLLASVISQFSGEAFPYLQELAAKQQELLANPVPLINHLGDFLLKIRFTSASWALLRNQLILLAKAIISARRIPLFDARAVNLTYIDGLLSFIESKEGLFQGDAIALLVRFVGLLGKNFSANEWLAIGQAKGDIPVNPIGALLAWYDRSYALLTASEQATLSQLFNDLGINYSSLYAEVTSWKSLDFTKEADIGKIKSYVDSLIKGVVALFTPTIQERQIGVFIVGSFVLKGSSIKSDRFDIDLYKPGDEEANYTITNIVAPTDQLGYHVGTLSLSDKRTNGADTYAFSYDVVPTLIGLDPNQYLFFFPFESELAYRNNVLYLREDVTASDLRSRNISPFRFLEADGTPHNVPIGNPSLSLVLSPNDNGTGFLLLAYQASPSLTIYGVVKVRYYKASDISYGPADDLNYVVEGGEAQLPIISYIPDVEGERIQFSFEWVSLSGLGITSLSLGEKSYTAYYADRPFSILIRVIPFSEITVTNVLEYLPYLQTVYHVGDSFSLLALRVACSYLDENKNYHNAGELLLRNPPVTVTGFSTAAPVAGASASIRYGDFEMDFTYTVLAKVVDH
mgnify:CR=1 FL=1